MFKREEQTWVKANGRRASAVVEYDEIAMPMKVREVVSLLEKYGWIEMRSKGSHRHFKHPKQALVITVPGSQGKELAPGTLNVILKKAGLK